MKRAIWIAALLAALFFATAAPGGRGGGFGGGRGGGFSGGRSGGGVSGGGYRGGGGFYLGGPRVYYGGRGSPIVFLVIFGGIALVIGGVAVAGWLQSRYATVSVAVNLRRGDRYARKLDELIADSEFETPGGRAKGLHRIANLIESDDVVDGFMTIRDPFGSKDNSAARAESLAREQMKYIGVSPEAVNVATPEGTGVRLDAPQDATPERSDACLLALVATVKRSALTGLNAGGEGAVLASLISLHEIPGRDMDALYFYYSPNGGQSLDSASANRIFLDLRSAAGAAA